MNDRLDSDSIRTLLEAVGAHLKASGASATVLVVGGAALCLRGFVERATEDVDVIAQAASRFDEMQKPDFSPELTDATTRVARDFDLAPDWFNSVVGEQWKTGLPDEIHEEVQWMSFGALEVGLAGRQALITLKLFASVDQGPASVHLQDLVALAPTDAELERASAWVTEQDTAPSFPFMVKQVAEHVRRRL